MIHELWEILVMHKEREYITLAFYANVQFCGTFLLFKELNTQETYQFKKYEDNNDRYLSFIF